MIAFRAGDIPLEPPTPVDALASQTRADHRRELRRARAERRRRLLYLLFPVALLGAIVVWSQVTIEHPSPLVLAIGGALVLPWLVELGARR